MRWFPLTLLLLGCEAQFTDLRPANLTSPDAGFFDVGPPPMEDTVHAMGTFEGRGSYTGMGDVSIVQRMSGDIELVFDEAFSASSVPGPVVVLTTRDSIGASINPGADDMEIAPLESSRGAQTYSVTGQALGSRYVWVFCKPFGVEIARAELMEVSQ